MRIKTGAAGTIQRNLSPRCDHVEACFSSEYVKRVTAPDGLFFADFETSIVLMASEKPVSLATRLSSKEVNDKDNSTVAMYFISTTDGERNGQLLEKELTPLLVESIQRYCQDVGGSMIVNVGQTSDKFDLHAYFGGADTPEYAVVYKIYLKRPGSVPPMRKSQNEFEGLAKRLIDLHTSFILFSKGAVILDVAENIPIDNLFFMTFLA